LSVESANRGQRHQGGFAPTVSCTLQTLIMEQDKVAVRGEADVELDPVTTEFLCFAQSGKSVFRCAFGGAAMADHRGKDLFKISPL